MIAAAVVVVVVVSACRMGRTGVVWSDFAGAGVKLTAADECDEADYGNNMAKKVLHSGSSVTVFNKLVNVYLLKGIAGVGCRWEQGLGRRIWPGGRGEVDFCWQMGIKGA